jgi:hypothetical protein
MNELFTCIGVNNSHHAPRTMGEPPELVGAIYMPDTGEWGDFCLNGETQSTEFEFTSVVFRGVDYALARQHNLEVCHSCGEAKSRAGGIFCWPCHHAHVHCFGCFDLSDSKKPCPRCKRGFQQPKPVVPAAASHASHLEYNSINNWSHLPTLHLPTLPSNDYHWSVLSAVIARDVPQANMCRHSDAVKHLCPRCSP